MLQASFSRTYQVQTQISRPIHSSLDVAGVAEYCQSLVI